ncbi:MAG TPA: ATP-binding protein [Candidatus Eisenbacteria bacterium]|uniref:ATP-binding protein n=1 Tax=Eiseniibacteriota bacterium TaxID=2212470 RepID=A0A7V2AUQ6_UNCEI|nr:ATP-binding protein [Candidatus Eisenbacteria bacterium]
MEKHSLHILNLQPELFEEFFAELRPPEEAGIRIYKTFPRFMKAIGERPDDGGRLLLFLPEEKLGADKLRLIRLARLDAPMFVVTRECSEKYYLVVLSLGIQGIIHPPFSVADVERILDGRVNEEIPFPRNHDLAREGQVRFDFLLPSKLSRILGVNRLVSMLTSEFGFPPEESKVNLPLVMDEALSNAIQHGNKGKEELKVHVRIYISTSRIVVQIEDQGEGFRIDDSRDPRDLENLYRGSGRGLYLIRELMDTVEFKKGGRLLEMEKRNPASDSKE